MAINFKKMVVGRHAYAKAWKERGGGKILGYFETYFPEEIAYAAGVLPVRILAEHEPDLISDKWIYGACYPVKDMANQLLLGRMDYINGLVNTEGCQWMFNAYEVVTNNRPGLFNHYLFLPDYTNSATSKDVLRSELDVFKTKMEDWTGNSITDEALDNAIEIYNKNRVLLRRICELRRAQKPVITGSEYMHVLLADQIADKAEMNVILENYITELENREPGRDTLRLMLIGSETWDSGLEELIESSGGNVVIDELDNGTSYFWNNIYPQKDRLMAISLRYLDRPHNPVKDSNWRRRPEHIFRLAEDYHVDGAIIQKQIYCHLHGTDNYAVWRLFRERNMPFHYLERDMFVPKEETALRIEAFMNMLREGATRLAGWHKKALI
ncbi:MAG: 2-hydroxyacyl-CoA dehydratase [Acidobacteriota bacterium]|jgi:benzoyl-CoA reductase subunit C|nr:2-hydroxyacyl-CoA dehydratase [Acidobacteriota bacterium]